MLRIRHVRPVCEGKLSAAIRTNWIISSSAIRYFMHLFVTLKCLPRALNTFPHFLILFLPVWFYFWLCLLAFISTRTDLGSSRLNLSDIFYIIIAALLPHSFPVPVPVVGTVLACCWSCLCFVASLAILWLCQDSTPSSDKVRQKLLKQILLTLTFSLHPISWRLFGGVAPLNEIHFSICYSFCQDIGLPGLGRLARPLIFPGDTFSIIICTASKAGAQALWVMRLADAQKT